MNIYILILISLYALGLGFLLGEYYADCEEQYDRYCGILYEKCLKVIFSPFMAIVYIFVWIKRVFFGFND